MTKKKFLTFCGVCVIIFRAVLGRCRIISDDCEKYNNSFAGGKPSVKDLTKAERQYLFVKKITKDTSRTLLVN